MRRSILIFMAVVVFVFVSVPAYTAEDSDYDPRHTILALGNIESDYELTGLFTEMMNFITGKTLRQEEAKRFNERYNRREQRQLIGALSGIRAYGGNLWSGSEALQPRAYRHISRIKIQRPNFWRGLTMIYGVCRERTSRTATTCR